MPSTYEEIPAVHRHEARAEWPVYWSAIWVGALVAIATGLIIGLIAIAVGAHEMGPAGRVIKWSDFGVGALIFSVIGAFVSFWVGGWVAAKVAGLVRSEPAILHGAIVWLVAVPIFLALAALGAGNFLGGWFYGLAGTPAWVATPAAAVADPNAAIAARNAALAAVTGLLIGLIGSVIGGWTASGEPMTFTHYRLRDREESRRRST